MKKLLLLLLLFIFANQAVEAQTITTNAVTTYDQTTATFTVDATGLTVGLEYVVRFYYDIVSGGKAESSTVYYTATGVTHTFMVSVGGLNPNTTYYMKPRFRDDDVTFTIFGLIESFTTLPFTVASITTGTAGIIGSTSMQITGTNLTDDGGSSVHPFGLNIGEISGNYTTATTTIENPSLAPASFEKTISDLSPSKKYYFRAYATNSEGTTYGVERSAYTEPSKGTGFTSITGLDVDDNTVLTLNWDNSGDGGGRIIVAYSYADVKGVTPTPTSPVDGTVYTGNAAFGSGAALGSGYVVYAGNTGFSVEVTDLIGDTENYEFYVYEYSGSEPNEINYLTVNPSEATSKETTLPIELISFSAKSVKGRVGIDWSTATELNNDYFEIERSNDAVNFEVVVKIPGAGNSNEILDYSIFDNDELEGTVYYRLKQTDFDGAFTNSSILPVTIGGNNELQISDVINEDKHISFVYNNDIGEKAIIHLVDINGIIVKSQEVSGTGVQLVKMDMGNLSHGVYLIRLNVKDETIVKKLVY